MFLDLSALQSNNKRETQSKGLEPFLLAFCSLRLSFSELTLRNSGKLQPRGWGGVGDFRAPIGCSVQGVLQRVMKSPQFCCFVSTGALAPEPQLSSFNRELFL